MRAQRDEFHGNHAAEVARQLARQQAVVDGVDFDSDVDTVIDADNEVLGEVRAEEVEGLALPVLNAVSAKDERIMSTVKRWWDMDIIAAELAAERQ